MPISLQKGQKVSLTKGNPGLTKVVVGLGWDVNNFDTGGDFDLDAAAFLLGESGKVTSSGDFVFYGNLKHSSGAVEHLVDAPGHRLHGELEDLGALHVDVAGYPGLRAGYAEHPAGAVAAQDGGDGAPALLALHHRRPGPVPEEDAGAPVGPVGDPAQVLRADDQPELPGGGV